MSRSMVCPCTTSFTKVITKAHKAAQISHLRTLASPTFFRSLLSSHFTNLRQFSDFHSSVIAMETKNDPSQLDAIFEQKRLLRSRIRKELKKMDPVRRSEEDDAIQRIVLEMPWFKSSQNICAYISCPALREVDTSIILSEIISQQENACLTQEGNTQIKKKLYVPHVVDSSSNMKMVKITSLGDLIANSMNILEPALVDSEGNQREDVMEASDPIDLIILPGLAFDRAGRRLGRSGGYYDMFLKKYQEIVKARKWKQPLLVGLSYSIQIIDGSIPVTCNDVPADALVSTAGVIVTSLTSLEKHG